MRVVLFATVALFGAFSAVFGQTAPRFEIGPVLRVDEVSVEGGASGATSAVGIALGTTTRYGIGGELTWAANRFERSYQSWFISYAQDPNADVRKSSGWRPSHGERSATTLALGEPSRSSSGAGFRRASASRGAPDSLHADMWRRRATRSSVFRAASIPPVWRLTCGPHPGREHGLDFCSVSRCRSPSPIVRAFHRTFGSCTAVPRGSATSIASWGLEYAAAGDSDEFDDVAGTAEVRVESSLSRAW
jgi:hypothetical protein